MVVDNNSNDHKLCPQTTFFVLMFWLRDHFLHLHWVHPKICCIWQCSWMSGRRNIEINLEVYPWTQTWQDLVFQLFILFNACVWRECWHLRKRWFTEVRWHRSFGKKINEIPTYMQVLGLDDAIVYQENSTKVKGCVCVSLLSTTWAKSLHPRSAAKISFSNLEFCPWYYLEDLSEGFTVCCCINSMFFSLLCSGE